ncbi:MAG: zinc transporter ZntB [Phycisphaeraceae bacterium]|nr:zinc transporter ZntB [Phycisphaeraceae bacterium]
MSAMVLDGRGGGREIGYDEIDRSPAEGELVWLHFDLREGETHRWLAERSGIPPLAVHALRAEEIRPRAAHHGDALVVLLRAVNLNPGAEPEEMISLRCWFSQGRVVTLREQRLKALADLRERIDEGNGPRTCGEMLWAIIEEVVDHISPVVDELEERLCELEEATLATASSLLRVRLGGLRREAIQLRRFTGPQRDLLNRLSQETRAWLTEGDRAHIRESADRLTRLIEDVDSVRERSSVTHEELTAMMQERQERRIYALSLVSTTFLPLTFVTGLLGMNVGGIPFAEHGLGVWMVLGMLIVLAGVQFAIFRWRRYL